MHLALPKSRRCDLKIAVADEGVAAVNMLFSRELRWIFREVSKRDDRTSSSMCPEDNEAEIKARPSISSGLSFVPYVFYREIHPPTPRSEATVCAVTRGNIAELAPTAFVALLVVAPSL